MDNDFDLILPQFDDEELPGSFFQQMQKMVSLNHDGVLRMKR